MPMAQTRRSYSGSGKAPGSIFTIRPFSTCAVMPQRGLAWQLGSQTVLIKRVSVTAGSIPGIADDFAYSAGAPTRRLHPIDFAGRRGFSPDSAVGK
jgi:hypothetical protein